MENKITLEFTEEELKFIFECVTVVSQVKWKGYNSKVEPIRVTIKNKLNELVQARIDTLKSEIIKLESTKHE